jgi:hypothetical protein
LYSKLRKSIIKEERRKELEKLKRQSIIKRKMFKKKWKKKYREYLIHLKII